MLKHQFDLDDNMEIKAVFLLISLSFAATEATKNLQCFVGGECVDGFHVQGVLTKDEVKNLTSLWFCVRLGLTFTAYRLQFAYR